MNNRIMAMLFALVAAMFISIVPVKAEAAVAEHEHFDNNDNCVCDYAGCSEQMHVANGVWTSDEDGHFQWCANNCGTKMMQDAHSYGAFSNQGADQHWRTCSVCGDIDKVSHSEGEKKDCKCDDCGRDLGHDLETIAAVAAKCETAGVKGHKKCKDCGALFNLIDKAITAADIVDPALEHTPNGVWEKDDKDNHYQWCSKNCGTKLLVAAHTAGEWKKYPSDTTKHFQQCTVCFKTLQTQEHTFEYAAGENDTHSEKCTVCGESRNAVACADGETVDHKCDACGDLLIHAYTGPYMTKTVHKTATCLEDGIWRHKQCDVCGLRMKADGTILDETTMIKPKADHVPNGKWEKDDNDVHYQWCANDCGTKLNEEKHVSGDWKLYPSDTTKHFHQCTVCYKTLETEEHAYKFVDVNDNYHKRVCETCKYDENVGTFHVDADGDGDCLCDDCGHAMAHTDKSKMTYVEAKAPTCTEAGHTDYYQCNDCGGTYLSDGSAWDPALDALGHDWKARPDTLNGQHLQKCNNCSAYQTLEHQDTDGDCKCDVNDCDALVHSHKLVFVAAEAATCTESGTEAYYKYQDCGKMFDLYQNPITAAKTVAATGHKLSEQWVPGEDGKHVKKCENCDYTETEAHAFQNGNVQCAVCGAEEGLTHVAAKAATCVENGNVEYWYSKVTGKMYADEAGSELLDSVSVEATGHSMSGWQDLGNGKGHEQVCMNDDCEHTLTESHDKANKCFCTECGGFKTGHKMEMVKSVAATCTKAGTQAYYKCSCGKLYDLGYNAIKAPASIAKLSHEMGTKVMEDAKAGKHYIQCKNCTYKMYEEHAMVMSDPLKGNYHQYLCACGELEIEKHYDKNGDNKCDVCDHSMNGKTVTVEQHDSTTVITGEKKTVDNNKSWFQNWMEVLTPSNSGGSTATTEKASEKTATSSASGSTTSKGTASTGASASANSSTAAPAGNASSANTSTNTAASQTNVIVQFINWLFGLLGF